MSQTATLLPSALNLRGTSVLVTGAASGIGRATAIVLAQLAGYAGHRSCAAGRRPR